MAHKEPGKLWVMVTSSNKTQSEMCARMKLCSELKARIRDWNSMCWAPGCQGRYLEKGTSCSMQSMPRQTAGKHMEGKKARRRQWTNTWLHLGNTAEEASGIFCIKTKFCASKQKPEVSKFALHESKQSSCGDYFCWIQAAVISGQIRNWLFKKKTTFFVLA